MLCVTQYAESPTVRHSVSSRNEEQELAQPKSTVFYLPNPTVRFISKMKLPSRIISRSIANLSITRSSRSPISFSASASYLFHHSPTLNPCKISSLPRCWHQLQIFRTLLLQTDYSNSVRMERRSDTDSVEIQPSCVGIVEVRLDRPEAKNAIGKDMLKGIQNALEAVNRDSSVNVVMICSSVPRVFCAGADLKKTERRLMSPSEVEFFVNSLRSTFSFLEALYVPTIAVIEGAALGGGLEMVLSCDLRICGENAVFSMPETGLAIIPGCMNICRIALATKCKLVIYSAGGTQRLPRVIGKAAAKELIFTGRKVNSNEAMSMGLVNCCAPTGEAHSKALQIARDINQKGPLALRMAKRAINEGAELDMSSALALEEECYQQLLNTNDRLEGLAAFAEKRKPRYIGE
ncbi:hypothetical protein ACLOJK_037263 [Asimina triloba]